MSQQRIDQIADLVAQPRGIVTDLERQLLTAAHELVTELRRRTPQPGRRIPCPYHPDQLAARCTRCREEATPPPAEWRNRGENA